MSNIQRHQECSYCPRKDTDVRGTPFLADVSLGAKMCWQCWSIAQQSSNGEIGAFDHSDMVFTVTHKYAPLDDTFFEDTSEVLDGIIEEALKKMPKEMVYAMVAGCQIETNYDPETGQMIIKTKNPVSVIVDNGRVTVYEKNDRE